MDWWARISINSKLYGFPTWPTLLSSNEPACSIEHEDQTKSNLSSHSLGILFNEIETRWHVHFKNIASITQVVELWPLAEGLLLTSWGFMSCYLLLSHITRPCLLIYIYYYLLLVSRHAFTLNLTMLTALSLFFIYGTVCKLSRVFFF